MDIPGIERTRLINLPKPGGYQLEFLMLEHGEEWIEGVRAYSLNHVPPFPQIGVSISDLPNILIVSRFPKSRKDQADALRHSLPVIVKWEEMWEPHIRAFILFGSFNLMDMK